MIYLRFGICTRSTSLHDSSTACHISTYTINHSWTWCGYSWPRWPSAIYCDHSINCSRQLNSHEKQCDKTDYNNWICFTTTHMMLMPRNVNHSFVCCSFSFLGNINVYKKVGKWYSQKRIKIKKLQKTFSIHSSIVWLFYIWECDYWKQI